MCDALWVLLFCALACRNMMEERSYPQGLRRWDKVEVDGFSAGCTVHGFTSWGKSYSTASLEKHWLTAFFQGAFSFLAFRHTARWETYILWSPTCNVVLNNTPQNMDSSANLQRNNSMTSISGQLCNSNLLLKWSLLLGMEGVQHWQPLSLGCQRASVYANCGSVFLMWTFFHQSQI